MAEININRLRGDQEKLPGAFPAGYTNDGVFGITNAGTNYIRIKKGAPNTMEAGVLKDGSDQTTRLNNIFSLSKLKMLEVDFEGGGAITINGTVNAQGKVIKWRDGTYFTGSGTLTNFKISAGKYQKLFDISVSLTNFTSQSGNFSIMWYGAVNDNTADAKPAIQKTFDTCVANQDRLKTIVFPSGSFLLNSPVVLYKWSGSSYEQVTLSIHGESDFAGQDAGNTRLYCNYKDNFGIGLQQCKSSKIEGIFFQGLFVPPAVTGLWYNLTLDNFVTDGSRDTRVSPNCAVAIDPFSNDNSIPEVAKYPGYSGFYRGNGSNSGCTGVVVRNCFINGFVLGVVTSPNGQTLNAELTFIEKCQFANVKICVSGCQAQEKLNCVTDIMVWQNTHTVFATGIYGAQVPGNWYISGVNIAGAVNQLVYNDGAGYYASYFERVFAESLGKFGFLTTVLQSSVKDSTFDFQRVDIGGGYTGTPYNYAITGANVLFLNCILRYYGTGIPVAIKGRHYFKNCHFESMPYVPSNMLADNSTEPSFFHDCIMNSQDLTYTSPDKRVQQQYLPNNPIYGKQVFVNKDQYSSGGWEELHIDGGITTCVELFAKKYNESTGYTVTPNSNREAIVTIGAFWILAFEVTRIVVDNSYRIMGIVTNVNTTNNTITLSNIPIDVTSGNYFLACVYPKVWKGAFLGDLTGGSNVITNVRLENWGTDGNALSGTVINLGLGRLAALSFVGKSDYYAKIISYNAGARTFTILTGEQNYTQTGVYCSLGNVKKVLVNTLVSDSNVIPFNSELYSGDLDKQVCTKAGVVNAALTGGGETRQALFLLQRAEPYQLTLTSNTPLGFLNTTAFVDTTAGNITITVDPTKGKFVHHIKRITAGANTLTITASSGTIDGNTSYILPSQYDSVTIHSDGTNFYVINKDEILLVNVRSTGAKGDGITDDTASIQAAINKVFNRGGGDVYFPNGTYIINGPLQTNIGSGVNPNSQLYIPSLFTDLNNLEPTFGRRTNIRFIGESKPNFTGNGILVDVEYSKKGTILKSTLTTGISGINPSVFGGNDTVATFGNINYNHVTFENITILVPTSATTGALLGGINTSDIAALQCNNVHVLTTESFVGSPEPTNEVAGIVTGKNSADGNNSLRHTVVEGFKYGFVLGEHCVIDQSVAYACVHGWVLGRALHPTYSGRMSSHWCKNQLLFPNTNLFGLTLDVTHFDITQFDSEAVATIPAAWYDYTTFVIDEGNRARGTLGYFLLKGGNPAYEDGHFFAKIGGEYIKERESSERLKYSSMYKQISEKIITNSVTIQSIFPTRKLGEKNLLLRTLRVGDQICIDATVLASTGATNNVMSIGFYVGANAVGGFVPIGNSQNNLRLKVRMRATLRTYGTSGTIQVEGEVILPTGAITYYGDPTTINNINTEVDNEVDIKVVWSNASASNIWNTVAGTIEIK